MLKKLILVLLTTILFLTGCQSIKGVNFNQMIINSSKITSEESSMTASLDLSYNKAKVQDKDFLKVLDLINHAKLDIQAKMQNSNTVSLEGNVILQKGKIPFQMYVDKKEMVLLLDHAAKPVRIPMTDQTGDDKWIQDMQAKLLSSVVNDLPNPKNIGVQTKSENVHGSTVAGYKVHEEVYANEVPDLLLSLLNNLLKDDKAISQIVNAMNEINKTTDVGSTMTAAEFKSGLQEFKTQVTQSLPEMKKTKWLSAKNSFKTDILLDRSFNERKSTSDLNIASIDDTSGLTGVRLHLVNETWNINKPVTATKIRYSSYLKEDATPEQFLATLDKKHSVLYQIVTSFTQSETLKATQVQVINNKRKADGVTVKGLAKGDMIKIYNASTGGKLLAVKQASGPTASLSVPQLGIKPGKVYVSITRSGMTESVRVAVAFKGE